MPAELPVADVAIEVGVDVLVAVLPLKADVPEADELEAAVELGTDVVVAADDAAAVLLPVFVFSLAVAEVTLPSADSTAPAAVARPPNPEYVCR